MPVGFVKIGIKTSVNLPHADTAVYDIVAAGFMVMNFGVVKILTDGKKNCNGDNPQQRTLHTAVIHNQRTGYCIQKHLDSAARSMLCKHLYKLNTDNQLKHR